MNDDPFRFDLIDEPVRPDDQLAKASMGWVGKWTTTLAEFGQRIASIADALRKSSREGRRIAPDELDGLDQIIGRRLGPDYFASHLERRFLTSS
jgi:hypothetical protein